MYNRINVPQILKETPSPPKELFVSGELPDKRMVAIVGARKPTPEGVEASRKLAMVLAENDICVISGLARGIDSAAHEGALSGSGSGSTIAVLPSDVNHIYPTSNSWLAKKILKDGGGLLSEYKNNPSPRKDQFLARNRIIAGLAELTIVVEAGSRSGALNTARHALEANRDVAAVPGSIFNPQAVGPNRLIKNGATPINNVEDVLDILGIEAKSESKKANNRKHSKILKLIDETGGSFDKLQIESKLPPLKLQSMLMELEIEGLVTRLPGNFIRINKIV